MCISIFRSYAYSYKKCTWNSNRFAVTVLKIFLFTMTFLGRDATKAGWRNQIKDNEPEFRSNIKCGWRIIYSSEFLHGSVCLVRIS
jgi:hypothetical protein